MTNNRFYVDKSPVTHLFVPYDNEKEFVFEGVENGNTIMKLVGLLNNALNENEQLKQELSEQGTQLDFLKDENKHMRELVNENEQLKSDVNQCKILIVDLKRQNQKLKGRLNDLGVEYYD